MTTLCEATVAKKIDADHYPVRKIVSISVRTHLFSNKITVHKLRGHDNDQPQTKIEFATLADFLVHFKDFKNVRRDTF
jgi:hypothetical protein